MNAKCGILIKMEQFNWIDSNDFLFKKFFLESVEYVESKEVIKNKVFNAISKQPSSKESIKEFAQFYTPVDVALYSAYQVLKNFDVKKQIIFDPCAGKGSLLIAIGAILAIKYNLRDKELLEKLKGTEICHETYLETIENIATGLSQWTTNLSKKESQNILLKNIKHMDFLDAKLPRNCLVIVNPPYKEVKGVGNLWLDFAEKISNSNNVKSCAMIVPISICSADRTLSIRENLLKNFNEIIALHHDTRPRPLFKNVEQRITIIVAHKNNTQNSYKTTGFIGHRAGDRVSVWQNEFTELEYKYCKKVFPKIKPDDITFFEKHFEPKRTLSSFLNSNNLTTLWVRTTGRYSLQAQYEEPETITTKWKKVQIEKEGAKIIIKDFIDGTALQWWKIFGDGRDISIRKFLANYGV